MTTREPGVMPEQERRRRMLVRHVNSHRLSGLAALMIGAAALSLGGCASNSDAAKMLNPDPPGKMYSEADSLLNAGKYESAARKFEALDRDHPYAPEARRAMVLSAYAYYKAGKSPEAIAAAQRYTTLHPGTKDAALAHNIIASAHFDEMRQPNRDQSATRKAGRACETKAA